MMALYLAKRSAGVWVGGRRSESTEEVRERIQSCSRVIRGSVIGVKENVYFEAAQAAGSPSWHTVLRHVLPNVQCQWLYVDLGAGGGGGRLGA